MKKFVTLLLIALCMTAGITAQVTTEPTPLETTSTGIVAYFHADEGNKGLMNQPSTAQIYAHTGVITSTSKSDSDWQYGPKWGDNSAKYKLEYVSPNLWKLNIGSINEYYGITDPSVVVKKLMFVFRTANNSNEGKGINNTDIAVPVYQPGLNLMLTSSVTGNVLTSSTGEVEFTASSTRYGKMTISVGSNVIASGDNVNKLIGKYTFPAQGDYEVTAVVESDGSKAESSISYCYPGETQMKEYPGGVPVMGAVRDGEKVRFCIAAPMKKTAILVGSWNDYAVSSANQMYCQIYNNVEYFWIEKDLEAEGEYLYYYNIDGLYNVGDPYARLVLDRANDSYISPEVFPDLPVYPASKVNDVPLAMLRKASKDKYDWKVKDFKGVDKSDLLIYELLFRDFTGTNGEAKGDGTVRMALYNLNYLKMLGVNAIELLPINEFNGNISWGYNPNFYFAPDKAYGTPEDYKEFIDACHENGIAVILDVVFNQSDWQHPWYQMYEVNQNPFYNATAPHAYSVLNDWKQEYPLVQQQWKDVLTYWLKEYNVDGFRFDLVKGLGDNSSYANNGDAATNAYNASRVARMRELQKVVNEVKPGAYFINENLATAKEENEMAETGQLNWANGNNQGCQFAMGYSSSSNLNMMYAPDNEARLWGSTVSYLESHDEQRLAYKQDTYGAAGVKGNLAASMRRLGSAAAQMILTPGAHMIWQFSEMGNSQNTKNSDGGNNTDPKIVCWDLLNDPDRMGLVKCYQELNWLRNHNKELFAQDASFSMNCTAANWGSGRKMKSSKDGKEIITVINPNITGSDLVVNVAFDSKENSAYYIASKSYGTNPSFDASAGTVTVPVNSYVVIASSGVTGVNVTEADKDELFSVAGSNNSIIVSLGKGTATIYSVSGTVVAIVGEGITEIEAAPGMYIVKQNGGRAAKKIVVK